MPHHFAHHLHGHQGERHDPQNQQRTRNLTRELHRQVGPLDRQVDGQDERPDPGGPAQFFVEHRPHTAPRARRPGLQPAQHQSPQHPTRQEDDCKDPHRQDHFHWILQDELLELRESASHSNRFAQLNRVHAGRWPRVINMCGYVWPSCGSPWQSPCRDKDPPATTCTCRDAGRSAPATWPKLICSIPRRPACPRRTRPTGSAAWPYAPAPRWKPKWPRPPSSLSTRRTASPRRRRHPPFPSPPTTTAWKPANSCPPWNSRRRTDARTSTCTATPNPCSTKSPKLSAWIACSTTTFSRVPVSVSRWRTRTTATPCTAWKPPPAVSWFRSPSVSFWWLRILPRNAPNASQSPPSNCIFPKPPIRRISTPSSPPCSRHSPSRRSPSIHRTTR